MSLFNCRISSNELDLDQLHDLAPWIPNSSQIRPTKEMLQRKQEFFAKYSTRLEQEELIAESIFGCTVETLLECERWKFQYNQFPYSVPTGTLHYVLWLVSPELKAEIYDSKTHERRVNNRIVSELDSIVGKNQYEYVWYENPKKSIAHMHRVIHYHVFWHLKKFDTLSSPSSWPDTSLDGPRDSQPSMDAKKKFMRLC